MYDYMDVWSCGCMLPCTFVGVFLYVCLHVCMSAVRFECLHAFVIACLSDCMRACLQSCIYVRLYTSVFVCLYKKQAGPEAPNPKLARPVHLEPRRRQSQRNPETRTGFG